MHVTSSDIYAFLYCNFEEISDFTRFIDKLLTLLRALKS